MNNKNKQSLKENIIEKKGAS